MSGRKYTCKDCKYYKPIDEAEEIALGMKFPQIC